jgi:hypothetical protein
MGEPLPIDLSGALGDFLEAYTERHEDVLVLEALSNTIDAKAKNVHITLKKGSGHFYIKFADDGPGMSKEQFKDYHTVSLSRKQKGEGIGFAGVGAKIYLASRDGSEILTVTSTGANNTLASKMYRIGNSIEHDISLKIPIEQIIGDSIKIKPFIGTWYQVKLTEDEYYYFCNNLPKILQKWFSHAMMLDSLKVYINHEMVEPIPLGKSVKKIIYHKQKPITCYFYYENEVEEENKHLVYTVFGKRIMTETFEFAHRVIEERRNKVFGVVDVRLLSKYLAINKEEFKKDPEVNAVKTKVRKEFYDFLKNKGFIKDSQQEAYKADLFTREFARRLDILLQHKEFADHLLLELEAEVVFVFNELVFAPRVEVVVGKECERPE